MYLSTGSLYIIYLVPYLSLDWFPVLQEKVKGKNKLVPRLLGINKESVVRVDEKTKEIMKHWPLTTVRRWAASPNSFTLVSICAHVALGFIFAKLLMGNTDVLE